MFLLHIYGPLLFNIVISLEIRSFQPFKTNPLCIITVAKGVFIKLNKLHIKLIPSKIHLYLFSFKAPTHFLHLPVRFALTS